MASKMKDYYQITWVASGLTTPLVTKKQLLTEIEMALLHLSESTTLSMNVNQVVMSEEDFEDRSPELRTYGFTGTVN